MKNRTFIISLIMLSTMCSTLIASEGKEDIKSIHGFPDATLTIFPVMISITGPVDKSEPYRRFSAGLRQKFQEEAGKHAHTFGLLLEEKRYDKHEIADPNLRFPMDKSTRQENAAAFGQFTSKLNLKTDYAIEIALTLHLEESWQEVYIVMVDAKGNIVWEDSCKQGDPGFGDFGGTELGRLELACSRLVPVMGLDKLPKKELAEDKKRALREIRTKEPPNPSEFTAMDNRLKTLREAGESARVLVYPARVGGEHTNPNCAAHLCELLNKANLCRATMAKTGPVMEGSGWPNEMQVLWLFAHNVREYVRQHPADSDSVLFADYWFAPGNRVWAVHFVLCDRAGEWVIVDLQNSHQEAFQRINPQNLEDCDRLVLDRMKTELQYKNDELKENKERR